MRKSRLRAITTRYKNHSFRSRLEARYAVYFDHLGIKWEYEPEGFELGNGLRYLPDFWLPEWGIWIEVKPTEPDAAGTEKARRLADAHSAVVIMVGEPKAEHFSGNLFFGWDCGESSAGFTNGMDAGFFAHVDGKLHLEVDGTCNRMYYADENLGEIDTPVLDTFDRTFDGVCWRRAGDAVRAALSARFEFGANGGAK